MTKCPFCHFDNEDGALFCEQCKSDLGGVPVHVPAAMATAEPVMAEAVPVEAVPMEVIPEPPMAMAMAEAVEAIPMAEAETVEAEAVEAMPVEAMPMAEAAPLIAVSDPMPVIPAPLAPPMAAPPPVPAAAPAAGAGLPPGAQPRLVVLRGQKRNVEYPIFEGLNFIGRADDKPVDIDLEDQEPPDRVWCSRQHACIDFEGGQISIEDLNSANGTFLNRGKLYPGQKKQLSVNDVIQIGNVQMKLIV